MSAIKILPPDEQPTQVDFHTTDGVFLKRIVIRRAGTLVPQHAHVWDHTTMLVRGVIEVWKDGVFDRRYFAPEAIFIAAGVKHRFLTMGDDTEIWCVHNLHGEQAITILAEHNLTDEI